METAVQTAAANLPKDEEMLSLLRRIAENSEADRKLIRLRSYVIMIALSVFAVSIAVLCCVLIPKAAATLDNANKAACELNSVAKTLNQVDFAGMSESINELAEQGKYTLSAALGDVEASLEEMHRALNVISQFDVEGLNKSREDFAAIVEPMAKLFGKR